MGEIELVERRSFTARGESGAEYLVFELQEVVYEPSSEDGTPLPHYGGRLILRLADGSAVRFIDATTFKIVETGEIIRMVT